MDDKPSSQMDAKGSYIAQADRGSSASVKVYSIAAHEPIDPETIEHGLKQLAQMPLDTVPDKAAVPDGSVLAFGHNRLFVGRQEDLKTLARMIKGGGTAAIGQIAAATGLGGIGKTQLASEFVHRYGQYFTGGVYWLNFADPKAVPAEIAACSRPGDDHFELETRLRLVLSAWQSKLPRLIVFDNCEDQQLLEQWRPKTGAARVLVTSRRQEWDLDLGMATLAIGVLERSESIELLKKFVASLSDDDARAIARELCDLPLALHLAGSYLKNYANEVSFAAYLEQLQNESLLDHHSLCGRSSTRSPTKHELHVGKTFALSYDRLSSQDELDRIGLSLLARAACFAPGLPIPKTLLLKTMEDEVKKIDPLDRKDGLSRLLDFGLIGAEEKGGLVLHKLLSAYVQNSSCMDTKAQQDVEKTALYEAKFINNSGYPAGLLAWQAHLRFVTERSMIREDEMCVGLCIQLGYHLQSIGDYQAARPYYATALKIRKKVLGLEHPDMAQSLSSLGSLLQDMGDYQAARPYYEEALKIRKKMLGPEHPAMAQSLSSLGSLLKDMGDYQAAEQYCYEALDIYMKLLGPGHPNTATSLNHICSMLKAMGDYQAAQPCYEAVLKFRREVLGPEHPSTATSLNDLGLLLQSIGNYQAARPYFEEALEIYKKALGRNHPNTAVVLSNLGSLLQDIGDYQAARTYFEEALEIQMKKVGLEHPSTATILNHLGSLLMDMGDYQAARPYYEEALKIKKKVLGPEHPSTANGLNDLGHLLQAIGDYQAARTYFEEALEIRKKVFGPEHPDTAQSLNNLGSLLEDMDDHQASMQYYEEALEIHKKVLGPEHPHTTISLNNLGHLLQAMGDYQVARPYYEEALKIKKKVLGPEHPDTALGLNNLGVLLADMGDYQAARPYYEAALKIRKKVLGPEHPDMAQSLNNLAILLYYENNFKEAARVMKQAVAILKRVLGNDHPHTKSFMETLSVIEKRLKKY